MISTNVLKAAGGLLCRRRDGKTEIATVRRNRNGGDWSLPKGKIEAGESWEDAALREVAEEVGCAGRIVRRLPPISYPADNQPKVVVFFLMELQTDGDSGSGPVDKEEVAEVVWLEPGAAVESLTYQTERALVAEVFAVQVARTPHRRRSIPFLHDKRNIQIERLAGNLAACAAEIQARKATAETDSNNKAVAWLAGATDTLAEAERLLAAGLRNQAWRHLSHARRALIYSYSEPEVAWERDRLLSEAKQKLSGWRRDSVIQILGKDNNKGDDKPNDFSPRDALYFARQILDEHFNNMWIKIDVRNVHLKVMGAIIFVTLLAFLSLLHLPLGDSVSPFAEEATVFNSWRLSVLALVLGAMGAAFSSAINKPNKNSKIPDALASFDILRPIVGATGGLVVAVILQSNVLNIVSADSLNMIPFAFAGGFSEHFVTRLLTSVDNAAGGDGKPENSDDENAK